MSAILKYLTDARNEVMKEVHKLDKAIAALAEEEKPKRTYTRKTRGYTNVIPVNVGQKCEYLANHTKEFLVSQPDYRAPTLTIIAHLRKKNLINLKPNQGFNLGAYLKDRKDIKFIGKGAEGGWKLAK